MSTKIGRPSIYETTIKPAMESGELAKLASNPKMTKRGIAKALGVSYSAFMQAQKDYKELSDFMKKAKVCQVEELESAARKEAMGYWITEKKTVRRKDESGKWVACVEEFEKWQRPSATMQIFLLSNWTHAKDYMGRLKYERDPAATELRKEEMEFRKEQAEKNDW